MVKRNFPPFRSGQRKFPLFLSIINLESVKILYLTDQTYLHGGIEKVLSQKASYFSDVDGDEVTIVTYNQQGHKPVYPFSKKIKQIDLGINYVEGISYFHPTNLKKIPKHRYTLKKVLKEIQPEVVISCSFGPDFYFIPFFQKQIPKIKEFHSTRHFINYNSAKERILKYLSDYAEKHYDKIVLLNEDETNYYKSDNLIIIPNPTETDDRTCSLSAKKIIAAGRISFQKNFEDLVQVFDLLKSDFPDWEVHIYGDDYLGRRAEIQSQINELGLERNIFFKGVTEDLKETFLDYSIYAMTSNHETFPMVLLEALAVGLPIVSYDCPTGPNRIVIDKSDGFIVPYKNSAIFAEQLKQLMTDESRRKEMGAQAKINARRFEISKVMTQWKDLFRNLLSFQPQT
ncbi:hypothetical protein ACM44_12380 [Chryseobacterium koreense CCUG 49689]|uniref:Glycosyl transferase family 1 domain-containing protein n=1 Tax=Chryseobacterium koreense CCUG 49689 TaxID=1304281 RepID=A0A0J7IVU9_9FLAO|nr:hypothetical protein ACM44_12380 [Chryseobacterium koreense CCUG 49689]